MSPLAALRTPADAGGSVSLNLRTLTPLYTGGVGQHGDQIHPSGLLGGLRRFSCLLAAAVGEADFEHEVWGSVPTPNNPNHHAKRIGLRVEANMSPITLPEKITWDQHRGWYYNCAFDGDLRLTLTRRGINDKCGINDKYWQLLLLALRIQVRHAMFGARDQFGLGVLKTDSLPEVKPITEVGKSLSNQPGLHQAFFASIEFSNSFRLPPDWEYCLKEGLRWRAALRDSLRGPDMDDLRHYVCGVLNDGPGYGSAINVSALYPHDSGSALRVYGVLPHTKLPIWPGKNAKKRLQEEYKQRLQIFEDATNKRTEILGYLNKTCEAIPVESRLKIKAYDWQQYDSETGDLAKWINHLAGV